MQTRRHDVPCEQPHRMLPLPTCFPAQRRTGRPLRCNGRPTRMHDAAYPVNCQTNSAGAEAFACRRGAVPAVPTATHPVGSQTNSAGAEVWGGPTRCRLSPSRLPDQFRRGGTFACRRSVVPADSPPLLTQLVPRLIPHRWKTGHAFGTNTHAYNNDRNRRLPGMFETFSTHVMCSC